MSFWYLLEGGISLPGRKTLGQKISFWFGRKLAERHKNVILHKFCLISPEARIHPREGAIEIGENSSVALGALIQGNVSIGSNSSVQAYCNITGYGTKEKPTGKITIGNFVRIASHTIIIGANHIFDDISKPIAKQGLKHAPIVIEDDVWIGSRVNILAGVTIGRGSVIGAGSVVTKDIPPYSVAVGVPAKVIKSRI